MGYRIPLLVGTTSAASDSDMWQQYHALPSTSEVIWVHGIGICSVECKVYDTSIMYMWMADKCSNVKHLQEWNHIVEDKGCENLWLVSGKDEKH